MHLTDDELISGLAGPGTPPLLAATYARVATAASFSRFLGPLGNYLIARTAALTDVQQVELEARGAVHELVAEFGKLPKALG